MVKQVFGKIYDSVLSDLSNDIAAVVPTFRQVKTSLYNIRKTQIPKLPKSRGDIILPDSWETLKDGRQFLIINDGFDDKILVFTTVENVRLVSDSPHLFMDGTFFSCPVLFCQLYIIHCLFNNKIYPAAFCQIKISVPTSAYSLC